MAHDVCPWWVGYWLASPMRKLLHNPAAILAPFVQPGMTVFEPGPGMGFFTLEMARLVGRHGRIIAVDIQPKMLSALGRKAGRKGVRDRIELRLADETGMGIRDLSGKVDFGLAFAMVHELPDSRQFFKESFAALKPGGKLSQSRPSISESLNSPHLSIMRSRRGFSWRARPHGQLTNDAEMRLLSSSFSRTRLDRSGDSGLGATERNIH